jgi:transcriptional regulator GlxA family with amidase domain
MQRRQLLCAGLTAGLVAASPLRLPAAPETGRVPVIPIPVPKSGKIKVLFLISPGANVIDLAGPWETFQDVMLAGNEMPFELATCAETTEVVEMTGGLRIEPTYSFDGVSDVPNVLVVGAQSNHSERFMEILRSAQGKVDVTMSVCTGAFKLAKSGILDGKSATTHHAFYDDFSKQFPKVNLVRGPRFVDEGAIVTAGGLTSGMSAALHVVARYFGEPSAAQTASYMEFVPSARPA